jgi:hypothetical protein
MNEKENKGLGGGIIAISLIQLILSAIGTIGAVMILANYNTVNKMMSANGVATKPPSQTSYIISIAFGIVLMVSIIMILMKMAVGVYGYFLVAVVNIVYSIVISGFSILILLNLVLPVIMGILIFKKKDVFGIGSKLENIEA